MDKQRVIVIGRHSPDLGSDAKKFEIVECKNVTFALEFDGCYRQFSQIMAEADAAKCLVLLQNVPGVLAKVIAVMAARAAVWNYPGVSPESKLGIGIIIAVPGPRLSGVSMTRHFEAGAEDAAADLVKHANARAKIKTEYCDYSAVTVTVDPVAPFFYSHIEWL